LSWHARALQEGPAQTLGAAQMAEQQAREASKARIAKKRPEKKMVVEIPAVVNDKTPFVPPAAYLKRWGGPGSLVAPLQAGLETDVRLCAVSPKSAGPRWLRALAIA
jgi:hypothetical protein